MSFEKWHEWWQIRAAVATYIGLYNFEQRVMKIIMSRNSCNFCIERDDGEHVEISCFDDAERGVWGMTYKLRYAEDTVAEDDNDAPYNTTTTNKLKRKRSEID